MLLSCGEPLLSIVFLAVGTPGIASIVELRAVTTGTSIVEATIANETFESTSLSLVSEIRAATAGVADLTSKVDQWCQERDQRDNLFYLVVSLFVGTVLSVALATFFSLVQDAAAFDDISVGAGVALAAWRYSAALSCTASSLRFESGTAKDVRS